MPNTSPIIDPEVYRTLRTPALVGPKDEVTYHDESVIKVIGEIFGYLLPSVAEAADGKKYFTCPDGQGNDLCHLARPVSQLKEIPRDELASLMGAWFTIRKLAADSKLDPRVKAILGNFRFPHPSRALDLYKLSTDPSGVTRLHIWWGIEPLEGKNPTTDGSTAFAKLLRCTVADVDERWKGFSLKSSKQLVMPGQGTSPIYIDPVTKAVKLMGETAAVSTDTAMLDENGEPVELPEAAQGGLDPMKLMFIIIGVGTLILLLVFFIVF